MVDARFVKPLDTALLDELADTHARIVTIEENVLAGGFGSAVAEHLADSPVPRARASACPTRSSCTATASGCCPTSASPPRPSPPPSSSASRASPTSPDAMRERLDTLLVARGLFATRSQARAAVLAGEVSVGGRPPTSPATWSTPTAELAVAERPRYVSRGGDKLSHALRVARVDGRWAKRSATSAAPPAASSTACCSTAPAAWSPSTSATACSTTACASTRA